MDNTEGRRYGWLIDVHIDDVLEAILLKITNTRAGTSHREAMEHTMKPWLLVIQRLKEIGHDTLDLNGSDVLAFGLCSLPGYRKRVDTDEIARILTEEDHLRLMRER